MDNSEIARGIAWGLKKKEMDDLKYHTGIFFAIIGAIIIGAIMKNIIIGIAALSIFSLMAYKKWYKE